VGLIVGRGLAPEAAASGVLIAKTFSVVTMELVAASVRRLVVDRSPVGLTRSCLWAHE
jgi:hypothetical protein